MNPVLPILEAQRPEVGLGLLGLDHGRLGDEATTRAAQGEAAHGESFRQARPPGPLGIHGDLQDVIDHGPVHFTASQKLSNTLVESQ